MIRFRPQKLPTNPGEEPSYIGKYIQLTPQENTAKKPIQYFKPEDIMYAIEITLKNDYVQGKYDGGLRIRLHDKKNTKGSSTPSSMPRPLVTNLVLVQDLVTLQSKLAQPEVIILDGSPPRSRKRQTTFIEMMDRATIKSEPKNRRLKSEPIDLDNYPEPPIPTKVEIDGESPSKRVKLENKTSSPRIPVDDMELSLLEKANEGVEEELKVTLRAAELIRTRNERNAIIVAKNAGRAASTGNAGFQ